MTDEKKKVLSYIDEKADVIIDTSDKIWDFAELSLREFKSGRASRWSTPSAALRRRSVRPMAPESR